MNHSSQTTSADHGTFKSYIFGFIVSIVLTLASYIIVVDQIITSWILISAIISLGIVQALVQLLYFLHLGQESRPRWNLLVFLFMALVLVVIVFGSLWIMSNLNYRVMPSMEPSPQMLQHEKM